MCEVRNAYSYFLDPETVRSVPEFICLGGRDVIWVHTMLFPGSWLPWTCPDGAGGQPPWL